jgi:2-amino-4-hydroxy-6-hydroxymethyldihydropteridine diphosphokinase
LYQAENHRTNQKTVYICFGSNQETQPKGPVQIIQSAYTLLDGNILTNSTFSPFFKTPAFPVGNGPDYVNSVMRAETDLGPHDLLAALHSVEKQLGRVRNVRWGPRLIDIDLLDYDGRILPSPSIYRMWRDKPLDEQKTAWPDDLILPHPRIQDRGFVLVPLKSVEPQWVHPVSHEGIDTLINRIDPEDLREIVQI